MRKSRHVSRRLVAGLLVFVLVSAIGCTCFAGTVLRSQLTDSTGDIIYYNINNDTDFPAYFFLPAHRVGTAGNNVAGVSVPVGTIAVTYWGNSSTNATDSISYYIPASNPPTGSTAAYGMSNNTSVLNLRGRYIVDVFCRLYAGVVPVSSPVPADNFTWYLLGMGGKELYLRTAGRGAIIPIVRDVAGGYYHFRFDLTSTGVDWASRTVNEFLFRFSCAFVGGSGNYALREVFAVSPLPVSGSGTDVLSAIQAFAAANHADFASLIQAVSNFAARNHTDLDALLAAYNREFPSGSVSPSTDTLKGLVTYILMQLIDTPAESVSNSKANSDFNAAADEYDRTESAIADTFGNEYSNFETFFADYSFDGMYNINAGNFYKQVADGMFAAWQPVYGLIMFPLMVGLTAYIVNLSTKRHKG